MPTSEKMQKQMQERDERVLKALKSYKEGAPIGKLMGKTRLDVNPLRSALRRLRARRKVKVTGVSRAALYHAK